VEPAAPGGPPPSPGVPPGAPQLLQESHFPATSPHEGGFPATRTGRDARRSRAPARRLVV